MVAVAIGLPLTQIYTKLLNNMQDIKQNGFFANTMLPAVPFGGLDIFVNDIVCVSKEWKQYRFPKSKKVRIRKKWSKRSVNFRMQDVHRIIRMQDKLYVSSLVFEKLKGLPQVQIYTKFLNNK